MRLVTGFELLLTILTAACHKDLGIAERLFACSKDSDCLPGRACHPVAKVCVTPDADVAWLIGPDPSPDLPGLDPIVAESIKPDAPDPDVPEAPDVVREDVPQPVGCKDPADCPSGACVVMGNGHRACAPGCDGLACPVGWACALESGPPALCLPVRDTLCRPCMEPVDCRPPGGFTADLCVEAGPQGRFCGIECSASLPCPDGYTCADIAAGTAGIPHQCVPAQGSCACTPAFVAGGFETACWIQNGYGTCTGITRCTPEGLAPCPAKAPQAERCNDQDDDCDGKTDEDFPKGTACDGPDPDTCASGVLACDPAGTGVVCENDGGPGVQEKCDGLDNDCDGATDEDPGLCDDGLACTADACASGECVHAPDPGSCVISGLCVANGTPDPANPCRACVPARNPASWTPSKDGSPCELDGNPCTLDACEDGACVPGVPADCSSLATACSEGFCLATGPGTYDCLAKARADGLPCDDDDPCTSADACTGGTCSGTPASCTDGLACTADTCDGAGGCGHPILAGWCVISNLCVQAGTHAPAKPCDTCQPSKDPTAWTPLDEGAACDDGSACTTGDSCSAGTCAGTPLDCDDADPCSTDSCNAATGCVHVLAPGCAACKQDGDCTDADPCTKDACADGLCTHGPVACDDGNYCTDDTCAPATGKCVHAANARPCDDGNACTVGDACKDGTCAGGSAATCHDGNPCTLDACDPAAGCTFPASTGTCDDGDPCTGNDHCTNGACAGATVNCEDGNACTSDWCDASKGCSHSISAGVLCDDKNPCTIEDACSASGACKGKPRDCSDQSACTADSCESATGKCLHAAVVCKDGNLCTDDSCDPGKGCHFKPNQAPCTDGDPCTTGDACTSGICSGTGALSCDDGNPCTADSCVSKTGCVNAPNTAPCSDGNLCTQNDACSGGKCVPGPMVDCDDSNACTDDVCNSKTGCGYATNQAPCNDSSACTGSDRCLMGACQGVPIHCDDNNACTADACDPAKGCTHSCTCGDCSKNCDDANVCTDDSWDAGSGACIHAARPDGSPCDDGDQCTAPDQCHAGSCTGPGPVSCDDGNACTADSCAPAEGCIHAPIAAPCDDGNACTTGDACTAGACAGPGSLDCNDSNPCTTDSCGPATGCVHVANTLPCDDANVCTTADRCKSGTCVGGTAVSCYDGNPCTTDSCSPSSGCKHANNTANCTDNNACTTGDVCSLGTCKPAGSLVCDDGNPCTDDSCNASIGCVYKLNAAACDDGSACTTPDACVAGKCTAGPPADCDDGNPCTDDSCVPATGCRHVDNTKPCGDEDPCTLDDTCGGGRCTGTGLDCDDGNECTADGCAGGDCFHDNLQDWTACGSWMVCQAGICEPLIPP